MSFGNIYSIRADGQGDTDRLTTSANSQALTSIAADGRQLIYTHVLGANHWDLVRYEVASGNETASMSGSFRRSMAELSPDGALVAYQSDETGRSEVYVQPYPGSGARIPVSVGGGQEPVWSRDGRRLYYRAGNRLMSAEIAREPTLRAMFPQELFDGPYRSCLVGRQYDLAPGGRFLVLGPRPADDDGTAPDIVVVQNWFEELESRVPTN